MTLSLTSTIDKSQILDLTKSICSFLLFPRLSPLTKNNLINAVQRLEDEAAKGDMHVDCRFAQDVAGETEIVIKIKFGAEHVLS